MRLLLSLPLAICLAAQNGPFLTEPYLQLGDNPRSSAQESLALLWHTPDGSNGWSVEVKNGAKWDKMAAPSATKIAVATIAPHLVWKATLAGLKPGAEVQYRVLQNNAPVFASMARARKSERQPYRFVTTGDCAANTVGQRSIATQMLAAKPDFVMIAGDIVYSRGRIAEYREKFYPVYNTATTPLLRSTLFIGAPGNHDLANRDVGINPDTLAYFYYWSQPLNGIDHPAFANLIGPEPNQQAFREAAMPNFPRMANFSFDYGNAHWTILDSNRYANWTDADLRGWLEKDLNGAKNATWKFVVFHHPGFNSSIAHRGDQWMRLLAEVFEKHNVDIVFGGHVHNYQRSFPLRFEPKPGSVHGGLVEGGWKLDRDFDGKSKTRASGVMYLVTGACGAGLYNREQQADPSGWLAFTSVFVSQVHSITVADVDGHKVNFRQVADNGEVVDTFTLSK